MERGGALVRLTAEDMVCWCSVSPLAFIPTVARCDAPSEDRWNAEPATDMLWYRRCDGFGRSLSIKHHHF